MDLVKNEYHLDGLLQKMTDQRGVVHEYTYNARRQLERDAATTIPGGVDDHVKSIAYEYDALGRSLGAWSFANANGTGTVRNMVALTWDELDQRQKDLQSHEGPGTWGVTPTTWHQNDSTKHGNDLLVNGDRLAVLYYPNGAQVEYRAGYNTGGMFQNPNNLPDRLSQVTMLKFTPGGGSQEDVVSYAYNGRDRLVSVDYVVPDVRRRLFDATTNYDYTAWDRFGRTVRQQWENYASTPVAVDRFDYAYDYAGNRLSRALTLVANKDEAYTYDGLLRLGA